MAELIGCVNLSHSPFYHFVPPASPDDPGYRFTAAVERLRATVDQARVDAMVVFGPDHFRNMFYDCMPAFCVGIERLTGRGDYGTPAGALPVAAALARDVFDGATAAGFDPAFSLHMGIDHGISQVYGNLVPTLDVPLVPVMVNTSGPPLPALRRCFEFGQAIGDAVRSSSSDSRVLVVGSGGLSHWPPKTSAFDPEVDDAFREFLINGRDQVEEMEPGRQENVRRLGASANGRVNAAWDRAFLELISTDPVRAAAMDTDEVERLAGHGGGEIRTWLAALGAWGGPMVWTDYEPVPSWITGMGAASSLIPTDAVRLGG
jgi:2,3-dihydroxyphenylpropionate 1,2-dioxygenase